MLPLPCGPSRCVRTSAHAAALSIQRRPVLPFHAARGSTTAVSSWTAQTCSLSMRPRWFSDTPAGTACPIAYRYRASSMAAAHQREDRVAETLLVVGGLYGNLAALAAIEALAQAEQERGAAVTVVFNGDFNFFNAHEMDLLEVNRRILLRHNPRLSTPQALPRSPQTLPSSRAPHSAMAAAMQAIEAGRAAGRLDAALERNGMQDGKEQLEFVATAGNIELAIAGDTAGLAGCGCDYPSYVSPNVVRRSDLIVEKLGAIATDVAHTSAEMREILEILAKLPLYATFRVGGSRVAVIHGDPQMLSGWAFGVELMPPADAALRARLGCDEEESGKVTPLDRIYQWFREADVDVFACTHTCLPYAQRFPGAGRLQSTSRQGGTWRRGGAGVASGDGETSERGDGVIFNNGSAGMPNFEATQYGLITRISSHLSPPPDSVYGCVLVGGGQEEEAAARAEGVTGAVGGDGKGVRIDAIKVPFDSADFQQRFLHLWPPGSPAHESYFQRIQHGPRGYTHAQANRLNLLTSNLSQSHVQGQSP